MTSTASGRYNNEANTNISLNSVGTSTGLAKRVGAYRDKAGVQSTNVKFSDLKGVYNGGAGDTSGYVTLDNTNYSSYLTHFQGYSNVKPLTNYTATFYLVNASSGSSALPIIYQANLSTGGYNWGCRFQLTQVMALYTTNVHLNTIMWKNYTLVMGKFDGTERAICYGPIEMKSVNSTYTTAYADVSNIIGLNAFIGQDYIAEGVYSVTGSTVTSTFRTTTRTKMVGLWLKSDRTVNHAWLDTAPFSTGAALSASWVSRLWTSIGDYSAYHKNNQVTFGSMYQYAGQDETVNPGKNYPSNGGVIGYYVFMVYDVGLRNATSGSVLNASKGFQGVVASEDIEQFGT